MGCEGSFNFIKTNWADNKKLSFSNLTSKLAMFLALSAASRVSEITNLTTSFMANTEDHYIFYFNKVYKTTRKGQSPEPLRKTRICVWSML